ncbi:hypothetical protein K438DRAFT_2020112 [Mycena galopus ATCC 62051]|nr:hypothetical protein K438DRAFT_2020112 [Mycena galopus ATCC 62051]
MTNQEEPKDPQVTKWHFETAATVYQTVYEDFFAWKEKHVVKILDALANPASPPSKQFYVPPTCFEPVSSPPPDSNVMYIHNYDSDGNVVKSEVSMTVYPIVKSFAPHPPYQYCTPASRSENARMIDNQNAPFVPFPDDPTFPWLEYLSCFDKLQWIDDQDQHDPDDEVIRYETVRRLHIDHHFTAEDVDAVLKAYGFRLLRISNESGLLWDVSQRDLPEIIWASSSKARTPLPPFFGQKDPQPDFFEQLNRGLEKFCPNLNCIQHNCHLHVDYSWEFLTRRLEAPKPPRRTSEGLRALAEVPCGIDCFLNASGDAMDDDSGDQTVLEGTLKIEPDILPCHLAVICRMTCQIAFLRRSQFINDKDVVDSEEVPEKKRRKSKYRTTRKRKGTVDVSGEIPPPEPCTHMGPCSGAQGCDCFKLKRYCERNCRCEDSCIRRWPGCNETCKGNSHCRDKLKCRCRMEERECDPEKCTNCNARNIHTRCTNVPLQLGRFKRFEVKNSKYGLGAFAVEAIGKGDLIGEYVGEVVDEGAEILGHREVIHNHNKLNYCFGIEGTTTVVDAQWLGNPTRFLNDSKPDPPNCQAYDAVVNGEHRIVIHALKRIKKGAELTLDYGPKYWNFHP